MDPKYAWEQRRGKGVNLWFRGMGKAVRELELVLGDGEDPDKKALSLCLSGMRGNFAAIVESSGWILALVDKIRSYPLFYVEKGGVLSVSNSARLLKGALGLNSVEELSLLEFRMAGYVTGRETLFQNLYQLQAGEFLVWRKAERKLGRERYYRFYPEKTRAEKGEVLVEELDEITNSIFIRVTEEAHGRPIWVPLSGGLDSRLVLCKLCQLGYDRLTAFSYGPPGNYEAKAAKVVAERLNVPWIFVPSKHGTSRNFFHSNLRKEYWAYCDGLCSAPNMQDIEPLLTLREKGRLPEDAVLVNGQSGDFITGGHIPSDLMEKPPSLNKLLDAVIGKHFSLWSDLKTEENLSRIKEKILRLLEYGGPEPPSRESLVALYEWWEWQERQCKYVVNGQRIYDFLGLRWHLPLWDGEYLHFWQDVPPGEKYRQKLYLQYLDQFNYRGVFKGFSPTIWRWPGMTIGIVPVARFLQLIFGKETKEKFYKYASYFGHYGPQYAGYSFRYFLQNASNARNSVSFHVRTWLGENQIS